MHCTHAVIAFLSLLDLSSKLRNAITTWVQSGPILEFKGSVRHVQKGYPTLVTQVDLILQN